MTDEGFSLPTLPASNARVCANKLLDWIAVNKGPSAIAAKSLVQLLQGCFHDSKSLHVAREKMWRKYYGLRSSEQFRDTWRDILKNINCEPCPIFYQFVTDKIMESLINDYYRLQLEAINTVAPLDCEDHCALRYTAGYVFRALKKKVEKSAHPLKSEIRLCLMEIMEDNGMILWNNFDSGTSISFGLTILEI